MKVVGAVGRRGEVHHQHGAGAGVLAGLLGWFSWTNATMGLLTGFVLGGLGALVLLVARRAGRRSDMPLGPALVLGAYLWCLLVPA